MTNGISSLDVRLGVRMLVKYPGLTVGGGLGMAVAIAIGAGFFAFLHSHLYPRIPLEEGDRIIALENWNVEVNNEQRQQVHDFVAWRQEMKSVENISAFRDVDNNLITGEGHAGRAERRAQLGIPVLARQNLLDAITTILDRVVGAEHSNGDRRVGWLVSRSRQVRVPDDQLAAGGGDEVAEVV